jgi:hypothetical protein
VVQKGMERVVGSQYLWAERIEGNCKGTPTKLFFRSRPRQIRHAHHTTGGNIVHADQHTRAEKSEMNIWR